MRRIRPLVLALLAAFPAGAGAWPADVYLDVRPGEEKFQQLSAVQFVEVEDPAIATAEVLPSGELLITGKSAGRTLLLLYAEGKFAVWRLRVGTPAREDPDALKAARAACGPGLKHERGELVAPVESEKCRLALRTALQADTFRAGALELVFNLETFQAQLRDVQAGLAAAGLGHVSAHYQGAGLRLEGKVTRAEHRKALWIAFHRSTGRVPLEDRLELTDVPPPPPAEPQDKDRDKESP